MTMPRKKKDAPKEKELELKFTGKMSILIELEGLGPLQWRINDIDITQEVVRVMLGHSNNTVRIDSYDKKEQKTFTQILDSFK
jgi:hypothetical protein